MGSEMCIRDRYYSISDPRCQINPNREVVRTLPSSVLKCAQLGARLCQHVHSWVLVCAKSAQLGARLWRLAVRGCFESRSLDARRWSADTVNIKPVHQIISVTGTAATRAQARARPVAFCCIVASHCLLQWQTCLRTRHDRWSRRFLTMLPEISPSRHTRRRHDRASLT